MSETPETDAAEPRLGSDKGGWVRADFARKLERERDEARDVVKILCDEKPERPIYFQPDIDEWMERHALAVQECEKLRRGLDAAIRERDELQVYLDAAHYATCNKELRQQRDEALSRCADLAHQILLNKLSETRP